MRITEVKVPEMGEFEDVEVVEIICKVGEKVSEEDPIISVESDKASLEIPSPASGVVREIKLCVGDKISAGNIIFCLLYTSDAADE